MNVQTHTNTNLNINVGSGNGAYTNGSAHMHSQSNNTSDGRRSWFGQGYDYSNGFSSSGVAKAQELYNGTVLLTELDRGTKKVSNNMRHVYDVLLRHT
jgi:hypothetical protein